MREVQRASATGPARGLYAAVRDSATDLTPSEWERYARQYADQVQANVEAYYRAAAARGQQHAVEEYLGAVRPPDRVEQAYRAALGEAVSVPPLSRAVWTTAYSSVRDEIAGAVRRVVTAQQTAFQAAAELRDVYRVTPSGIVPTQATQRVLDAARRVVVATRDPQAIADWQASKRELERQIGKLVTTQSIATARETLGKIEAAVLRGNAEAAERAVRWNVWHRQQAHAIRTLETEQVRAWNLAYVEETRHLPGVIGWEWETDDEPCDECEALSGERFTADDIRYPPLHPHCRCRLVEVIDESVIPTDEEWERLIAEDDLRLAGEAVA